MDKKLLQNVEDFYPLSPLQLGLLYHTLSTPEERLYFNQALITLKGDLDIALFRKAWQQVINRHPVLRAFYVWQGVKEPIQVIRRNAELPLVYHDWRGLRPETQQQKLEQLRLADLQQGFDLSEAPLLRITLARLTDDHHELLWSFHHLLMDGWSMFFVLQEVFGLYDAYREGRDIALRPRRPYREYIAWVRRQDMHRPETFWRQRLSGFTSPTRLPAAYLPGDARAPHLPELENGTYATQILELPDTTRAALERLAQSQHLTLNTITQGAWAVLLSRNAGTNDVVYGMIAAGRPAAIEGVDAMLGLFINTLPSRVLIQEEARIAEWLTALQNRLLEIREFEYSPLAQVQGWSEVAPGTPLFESIFMFENYHKEAPLAAMSRTLEISNDRWYERQNYPLAAIIKPEDRLKLQITYDRRRFSPASITRLLRQWQTVLDMIARQPEGRVKKLSLLAEEERQRILVGWNQTALDFPRDTTVLELVARQAKSRPDAIAVSEGERSLSYGLLLRRARQLARHLREMGAAPETRIAICTGRSIELIVGSLAVVEARAAYLPIDPAQPQERLAYMLQDAGVSILLTTTLMQPKLPALEGVRVLCLDAFEPPDRSMAADLPAGGPAIDSENLAYVIYTSGSTGIPKGVQITHRGLRNLVMWHQHTYRITADDRATQVASPGFDASVWEIWPYLAVGASLHIPDDETLGSPPRLVQWLADEGISISFLPTPIAEAMLVEPHPAHLALRALLVGGDKLHRFPREGLPFTLYNNYGPTEYTVVATWTAVETTKEENGAPPIGRPVANTSVYVLDAALRAQPVGVAGELHIGGESLARGYLHKPALTAEKFIPNPFFDASSTPESMHRLYKTGDLVRLLPDGRIEFLGRIDEQVKIRGNRVELGEIEAWLQRYPGVREGVCVVREDEPGKKRLVAYFTAETASSPAAEALQGFLREHLPDYMLPAAFVHLNALPLTTNGKVDRKALPVPEIGSDALTDGAYVAPRTPLEAKLAEIWRQVLGASQVGIHDNFFALGGDSILSLQIIAKANQAGVRISPRQLFTYPTIAQLAGVVAEAGPTAKGEQVRSTGVAPLTPIQRWFFEQDFAGMQHWNMAMLLASDRPLVPSRLDETVHALIAHHDALRQRFWKDAAGWHVRVVSPEKHPPVTCVDVRGLEGSAKAQLMVQQASRAQTGLDLQNGPLMQVVHFDAGPDAPHFLLLVFHHLAVDGVSLRILHEDLESAYCQLEQGKPVALPAQTLAYAGWARKLVSYAASSPDLLKELDFWKAQVPPGDVRLPVDSAGTAVPNTMAEARAVVAELEQEQTLALLHELPQRLHTQINDALLTALVRVWREWTGFESMPVTLEGHGREALFADVDISRTVGWFTSLFPLHLRDCQGDTAARIKSVKEQLRRIPQRGVGFGILRYLHPDARVRRQLASLPQPQFSFNYLGQFNGSEDGGNRFRIVDGAVGPLCSPRAKRLHLIEVTAVVRGEKLRVEWQYNERLHRRETIERLAGQYLAALGEIIHHGLRLETAAYTPSDFPQAGINQEELDTLLGQLQQAE